MYCNLYPVPVCYIYILYVYSNYVSLCGKYMLSCNTKLPVTVYITLFNIVISQRTAVTRKSNVATRLNLYTKILCPT